MRLRAAGFLAFACLASLAACARQERRRCWTTETADAGTHPPATRAEALAALPMGFEGRLNRTAVRRMLADSGAMALYADLATGRQSAPGRDPGQGAHYREAAIVVLALGGQDASVPAFVALAAPDSAYWVLRGQRRISIDFTNAVLVLARHVNDPRARARLIELGRSPDPAIRGIVMRDLRDRCNSAAADSLFRSLDSESPAKSR